MKIEIWTCVTNTKTGAEGFVINLTKDVVFILVRGLYMTNNGGQPVIKLVSKGVEKFNYPDAFINGELEIKEDKPCLYDEFCYIYEKQQGIKCKNLNVKQWARIGEWKVKNFDEKIVVFPFEHRIMFDQTTGCVAFTTKSNFEKLGTDEFNLHNVCRIGKVESYQVAKKLICNFLGYKEENVFEMDNNENKVYTRININDI